MTPLKINHSVVLDQRTATGAHYRAKHPVIPVDDDGNPVLDCAEIDTDHPHYLSVVHLAKRRNGTGIIRQNVRIPHYAVVRIYSDEEETSPIGFTGQSGTR